MTQFLFKRSGTADKRPDPAQMALGEVDLNYDVTSGGLFYKSSSGGVIKVGPAQVSSAAPNATPAGSTGNSVGEFWYDTSASALKIWSGSAWVSTAGSSSAATPTAAGAVLGVTNATNAGLGCNALLSNTGTNNSALGLNAGCAITTGTCNVAIGNGAQVASATGNCQLAIGFSATANWLTGNSTKAIKPGAGIIDCANSCGTAGQFLMSNGSNAICWGQVPFAGPEIYGTVTGYTTGNSTYLGCQAGLNVTFASNTLIGVGAMGSGDGSANTAIGSLAFFAGSGNNNAVFGNRALCALTTGCSNVALGSFAGCGQTSGNCNVAIGPSVNLPTLTGSCQLAIGFSATDNWLTGDSTKAIKPGAGIIDCAASCGTAGQALFSDGANAIYWGDNPISIPLCCLTCYNTTTDCGLFGGNLVVSNYSDGQYTAGTLTPGPVGSILCYNNAFNGTCWIVPNFLRGNEFAKGSIAVGCAQAGGGVGGLSVNGTGNSPGVAVGYYLDIPLTGGSGTGATANINVINGGYFPIFETASVVNQGSGYLVGEALTVIINGTTLSYTVNVDSLAPNTINNYTYLSVGTNGQVLTADSACTNGVKWGAVTAAQATPTVAGTVLGCTTANNTGLGSNALLSITTGASNTALGINAGCAITTGCCNAAFGNSALGSNTSGSCNTAVGHNALANGNSSNSSVAVGMFAMCQGTANGTTAIGTCALKSLTTGVCNTAIGFAALSAITTGQCNTAIGYRALVVNVSGARNTAIGEDSLPNATGSDNVAIGNSTLQSVVGGGDGNTVVGSCAAATASGQFNTVFGFQALCDVNSPNGSNNIIIGCCAATPSGGVSGSLFGASNRIVMGNSAHTCAQIQIAWSVTSDVRDKALDPAGVPYGLLFVEQLEPIAYRFCNRETNEVTDDKLRYGFSAQNVRGLEGDIPVISNDDNSERLNITDSHLLPVLVNAIKELSDKNKLLEERIAALEDK